MWAELWSALDCNMIHNAYSDGVATPFTKEECERCFPNNDTYTKFKGEYIHKEKLLDSWQLIVDHADVLSPDAHSNHFQLEERSQTSIKRKCTEEGTDSNVDEPAVKRTLTPYTQGAHTVALDVLIKSAILLTR